MYCLVNVLLIVFQLDNVLGAPEDYENVLLSECIIYCFPVGQCSWRS